MDMICYDSAIGAPNGASQKGPLDIKNAFIHTFPDASWHHPLANIAQSTDDKLATIRANNIALAKQVERSLHAQKKPFVLGGDHSCAVGTWSAVAHFYQHKLGLIWIDAHLDAHTPDTTPSQNIHGMPVAALLGHGDPILTSICTSKPKIRPDQICIIGARDYEQAESDLLHQLGVKIIYMHEVEEKGIALALDQAIDYLNISAEHLGISIDLDGFDPSLCPAVNTPSPPGIDPAAFCDHFKHRITQSPDLFGAIEITEFNPDHDEDEKSLNIIGKLLEAGFKLK